MIGSAAEPADDLRPAAIPPSRRDRLLVDLVLWLVVASPVFVSPFVTTAEDRWVDVLAAVLAVPLLVARRRWPRGALAVTLVLTLAATLVVGRPNAMMLLTVVLLFHVAATTDRRTTIVAGVAGLGVMVACIAIIVSNEFLGPELLAALAWPALAVAAGDAVRSRAVAIAAAEDRALRAEQSKEDEARRRVAESRLHIARELHDVVAHGIAVINVQAGVAEHQIGRDPDASAAALRVVRATAHDVLDELGSLVGVLRTDLDEPRSNLPAPCLDDLDDLIETTRASGLRVALVTSGAPRPVHATAEVAAYRTVQEALTNAHKHGDGTARVSLVHAPDELTITITNPATRLDPPANDAGFGLIGMRERVHAAGGTLDAGPTGDGMFEVRCSFPVLAPATAP